jgi:hypothetical protein
MAGDRAEQACRSAISTLGWRLLEDEGSRLVTKEVTPHVAKMTWAAKVEVLIQQEGSGSNVELNGSITGMGPIQKNHLKGQIGALKNNIGLAAEQHAASPAPRGSGGDISGELERLASLHEKGALSDEEFSQAKTRLLAS